MKLVIEIDDNVLKKAIDEKVSQAIAALTTDAISAQIETILAKKFDRVDAKVVQAAVANAAADAVKLHVSSGQYGTKTVKGYLGDAAIELLRQAR